MDRRRPFIPCRCRAAFNSPHPGRRRFSIQTSITKSERLRLSLVCKTWKECFHEIKNIQEFLPWLMCYIWWDKTWDKTHGRVDSICKLADPFAERCFTVEEATNGLEIEIFASARAHVSSHGWVLFSRGIGNMCHYFLYSPFTHEVISFPGLMSRFCSVASFYLIPASSDCMVVALSSQNGEKLEINSCHPGDESWKTFVFYGNYDVLTDVGYTDESFYCSFECGKLGAFNIKQQEWKESDM
ncbi:hypothetical protein QYF36_026208 [Acer negundo]|nr:hypothetical protein QYF36_026208 [Acer negundo]